MDRRVMLAIATVLSFVGVLGLYFYSCSIQPISVRPGDLNTSHVGNLVRTSGFVMDHYVTGNGDLMLDLADYEDGATIGVYVEANVYSAFGEKDAILQGAEIGIVGEVREYLGELELVVASADGIAIIQYPDESSLTIEVLARNPVLFVKREVTVHGQIQNIKSSVLWNNETLEWATDFQLRYSGKYSNHTIDCRLIGHDVTNDFHQGQLVVFTGIFDYDEREAKYEITSYEMTLQS